MDCIFDKAKILMLATNYEEYGIKQYSQQLRILPLSDPVAKYIKHFHRK